MILTFTAEEVAVHPFPSVTLTDHVPERYTALVAEIVVVPATVFNSGIPAFAGLSPVGGIHSNIVPDAVVVNTISEPSQVTASTARVGVTGNSVILSTTKLFVLVHPLCEVTTTVYVPLSKFVTPGKVISGALDVKPFGPVHA